MAVIKKKREIQLMKKAGILLSSCHRELRNLIKPGITTLEINDFVEDFLIKNGASPEQKGYRGYQYATCASINDEVCHGFPRNEILKKGDIVTIDMVVNLNGWLADSAWTYAVGEISSEAKKIMDVTKEALYKSISKAVIGNRMGDIGHEIQSYVESQGFSVVREFVGHGIGQKIHEPPQVLHYGQEGRGPKIKDGMVFTIEPMVNIGSYKCKMDKNGWTARTIDGSLSAQYEHTIAITKDGPIILTEQDR